MKVVIIDQARMTSTRLPGKVMKSIMGKSLLEYQLERLERSRFAQEIVVAATTNESDAPIVDLCRRVGVSLFRGSEEDVLSRYYGAAKAYRADVIVRVTSDCPLIDPKIVDKAISFYINHAKQYDYVSNTLERSYPRGMDCEVFPYGVLEEAHVEATAQPDREHVTPFIYRHPERYRLANIAHYEDQSHHRWTVDTIEDFELIKRMMEALYLTNRRFTMQDCLALLDRHPDWEAINANVEQKVYGQ
jgi:spore coat polysaccharide biosynthesis protein SpsF